MPLGACVRYGNAAGAASLIRPGGTTACPTPWEAGDAPDGQRDLTGGTGVGDETEYMRVKRALSQEILSGAYPENSRLPTERALCEEYAVSRITVRQALSKLEDEGRILRQQGRGTFVRPRVIEQPLSSLYSFSEELKKQNIAPGTRMLSLTTVPAQPPVQKILGLEPGRLIRVVCRLRLADEMPYAYETSYIPAEFLGDATGEEIALHGLYGALAKYGGVRIDKATETFEAVLAPQYVAEALGRRGVLSVMQLDRVAFSGGRAVEYCSGFICGDKYRFRVTLE